MISKAKTFGLNNVVNDSSEKKNWFWLCSLVFVIDHLVWICILFIPKMYTAILNI
jgi:hypothetical protein